ncbi:type I toxin-antitoxin system Ibs family toxin, partial [Escherichia coli]
MMRLVIILIVLLLISLP